MSSNGGFHDLLDLYVTDHGDGRARAELEAGDRHLNGHGTVHGGAIAVSQRLAMGTAVAAAGADGPVTVEMKVTYLRPGEPGTLVADATVRKRGKRVIVVEAEVTQGGETVALANATSVNVAEERSPVDGRR
jgi:uncharacterized protein (TIGR00369 family)